MHIQFQLAQQCIQISTRINSSNVHTYIFVCSTLRVILQGFVDPIMQHGVRIEAVFASLQQGEHMVESTSSFLHTIQSPRQRTIILWTELFPKKRREKIQGEILQSIFEYRIQWCFHIPTRTTVFPHAIQQLQVILHTELILPQEILQLQGSSRAGSLQQLFPVSPSILHSRIRLLAPLQHSKAIQHKQASSISTRQKQHSTWQAASTQSLQ